MWQSDLATHRKQQTDSEDPVVNLSTIQHYSLRYLGSGFGGLGVACWPLILKIAGSNPAEAIGFLRVNKNPQHVGRHECLSVVIVVCCQVEASATN